MDITPGEKVRESTEAGKKRAKLRLGNVECGGSIGFGTEAVAALTTIPTHGFW